MTRTPTALSSLALSLALALALAAPAHAGTCEGVTLPDSLTVAGTTLTLNGMGVREATFLNVNVYVAGLYLEHRSTNGAEIAASTQRKRLVLHFVRNVSHTQMADAFTETFANNASGALLASLQDRIHTLQGWMTNMSDGGEVAYTYTPGTGIQVQVGSSVRGVIPGDDFARVFFSIWLGAHPPNAGLRTGLLGGHCG